MCCGSKRAQLTSNLAQRTGPVSRPYTATRRRIEPARPAASPARSRANTPPQNAGNAAAANGSLIAVSYVESVPVRVQGLTTGRSYEFSPSQRVQEVDAQDAPALLNTRFFRRA